MDVLGPWSLGVSKSLQGMCGPVSVKGQTEGMT